MVHFTDIFSLDPSKLPTGEEFDEMVFDLESSSVLPSEILEAAFIYQNKFHEANELYKLALIKTDCSDKKAIYDIKIYMLGLKAQHDLLKETDFYEMNMVEDKKLDLLKGFYFYKKREYEKAYFSFSKIPYSTGMSLVQVAMKNSSVQVELINDRIKCYSDCRYWKSYEAKAGENKNFLFRINKSDVFEDEKNTDVILTKIENGLKKKCSAKTLERYIEMLSDLKKTYGKSAEILYLIGKIHHLRENYDNAKECYIEALKLDESYLPAKLNLGRISGKISNKASNYTEMNDTIALLSIKKKDYNVNLGRCSDFVRKVCQILIKYRNGDKSIVEDYENIINKTYFEDVLDGSDKKYEDALIKKTTDEKENICEILFEKEAIYNNLAISLTNYKERACQLLENALSLGSVEYEDYLKYNLGIIREDKEILSSLNFKEARWHVCALENDTSVENEELRGHMLIHTNLEEAENVFLALASKDKRNPLYINLCLGCINIDKYLERDDSSFLAKAKKYFMKNIKSFYSINGLGIVAFLQEKYDIALKFFKQIVNEYDKSYYNIACCYIMINDYKNAVYSMVEYLKNHEEDNNALEIIEMCCSRIENLRFLKNFNISKIKELYNKLHVESSENIPNDTKEKAEKRKLKIEELLEARKKLNLD